MMQELKIAPSKNTPEIFMCPTGIIRIKGRSIHENVSDFFAPVETWINKYIINPAQLTIVELNLEYCNSSSAKVIIHILQQIMLVDEKEGKSFVINWYYEDGDDDILERGEYFAAILNVPMNFIKIKSECP
jgi:hypothetical protein